MKVMNYKKSEMLTRTIYAFCLAVAVLFSSCEKDQDNGGYFELKDSPSKMEASAEASSETYSFKSNGKWKIEPLRKEKWINIEPLEGEGDGTFTVKVNRNTSEEARAMTLFFTVDGSLQNAVFKVEQAAATGSGQEEDRYLKIDDISDRLEVLEAGHTGKYILRATGKWKLDVGEEADWLNIEPMEGTGDGPVTISVNKNTGVERTAHLLFFLDEVQQANSLPIHQEGIDLSEEVVFAEDFNWLGYGSAIFYTTTEEKIISSWTAGEQAKGWVSSTSADNSKPVYARQGFVKLGKTNYGADLISPKLTSVQGTKNLLVKFKAVPYQTAGGTKDGTALKVNVIGPGTVSINEFSVDNWPNYDEDPTCTLIWAADGTERSFIITGATNETQIRFLGGDFDLREASGAPINKNRIFLDDIEVTVIK